MARIQPTPIWYVSPERQLERARQLWPNAILPEPPKGFTPATASEVPLLHVPDSFYALWAKIVAPAGYTKDLWMGIEADKWRLRLIPNKVEYTKPVWLGFDPEYGRGVRSDSLWGRSNLAANEVFSAVIQFPDWSLYWLHGASPPNLSGYQCEYEGNWSCVPYLYRWDWNSRLKLRVGFAACSSGRFASPSVREC